MRQVIIQRLNQILPGLQTLLKYRAGDWPHDLKAGLSVAAVDIPVAIAYLHKTTTTISQNHAMVCTEDLQVRYMSKSAAGNAEAPGRNVKAKSGLNQSILDQGWFEFR
ncbi:MAG: cytosine methyltransferase, partial [Azonexus sp.]